MEDSDQCRFVKRCPMFSQFASQATLRIFQIHYCQGEFSQCERYKRASAGVMPPADLLPDGSLLRNRTPRKQEG